MTRNHHLANLIKYQDQPDRPDLSVPQSLQLYLRFDQLIIAAEFELWQLSRSSLLAELKNYGFLAYLNRWNLIGLGSTLGQTRHTYTPQV
ncbi:unnamed protein product [Trifolium pratense]|uniref:Uncharacterized protein n=1 Tax=Trifolium pratense TaxID=57577 RepID=A0ACB0K6X3_TRIPR|nr:unnamed protein product [Trifolium pratense]